MIDLNRKLELEDYYFNYPTGVKLPHDNEIKDVEKLKKLSGPVITYRKEASQCLGKKATRLNKTSCREWTTTNWSTSSVRRHTGRKVSGGKCKKNWKGE